MRKEKIYELNTEKSVEEFVEKINEGFYYIDEYDECWKGIELKRGVTTLEDFNAFMGTYREIEPYEFYYIEKSDVEYKRDSIIYHDSDAPVFCASEDEAVSCCFGEFESLHSYDKQKSLVAAYKCFGIPECIECMNDAEIIGFALRYNCKNYFCNYSETPNVIFMISKDLERLDADNVEEYDEDLFYCSYVHGAFYGVRIDAEQYRDCKEIYPDEDIHIFQQTPTR